MNGLTWQKLLAKHRASGTLRAACEKSWALAQRLAENDGVARLNAASMAGHYLELACGDVAKAIRLVPKDRDSRFWNSVLARLEAIAAEERDVKPGNVVQIRRPR